MRLRKKNETRIFDLKIYKLKKKIRQRLKCSKRLIAHAFWHFTALNQFKLSSEIWVSEKSSL